MKNENEIKISSIILEKFIRQSNIKIKIAKIGDGGSWTGEKELEIEEFIAGNWHDVRAPNYIFIFTVYIACWHSNAIVFYLRSACVALTLAEAIDRRAGRGRQKYKKT